MFPQPNFFVLSYFSPWGKKRTKKKKKKSSPKLFSLFLPRFLLVFYFHLIVSKLKARPCANAAHC